MQNTYHALSETGQAFEMSAEQLMGLFTDWNSWRSFLAMSLGKGAARMVAHMEDGTKVVYQVAPKPFEAFG